MLDHDVIRLLERIATSIDVLPARLAEELRRKPLAAADQRALELLLPPVERITKGALFSAADVFADAANDRELTAALTRALGSKAAAPSRGLVLGRLLLRGSGRPITGVIVYRRKKERGTWLWQVVKV